MLDVLSRIGLSRVYFPFTFYSFVLLIKVLYIWYFQVVLGGGQDASAVTTTDHRAGKFEAKFYDKVNLYF